MSAIEEKTKRRVFDHAPKEDLEGMIAHPHSAPRHKSFDREYPGYASFSRSVDAYDRGPRSVSFSMPHAAPVPQASILDSIYSWWGSAPVATPAPAPTSVQSTPEASQPPAPAAPTNLVSAAQTPQVAGTTNRSITPESRADSYTSLASVGEAGASQSDGEGAPAARPSPAVTPVNKIAERLQKIRVQKQQQV